MFLTNMDPSFLAAQLLLFMAVLLIFSGARHLVVVRTGTVRRLKQKAQTQRHRVQNQIGLALEDSAFKDFERHLLPENPDKLNELREKLMRAGYRKSSAPLIYYASRIGLSIAAALISVLIVPLAMPKASIMLTTALVITMIFMAFMFPKLWVERTWQYRKMAIEKGFPDALDLLLVCIEAGNGFDQALNRVVGELKNSHAILADELSMVTRELRAGKDRYRVLGDFAKRTGAEDIISFITVIKQADKFGVSIAEALRVYSSEMRDKRYMLAEEKANMMPVKLALGAIAFTVPPAILVMVGPSIILIIRNLGAINT